jgi:hypothetical protein
MPLGVSNELRQDFSALWERDGRCNLCITRRESPKCDKRGVFMALPCRQASAPAQRVESRALRVLFLGGRGSKRYKYESARAIS